MFSNRLLRGLLGLLAFLLFAQTASAFTHAASATGGTSVSFTATANDGAVVWVVWAATTGTPSISDTHNTYTACTGFPFHGLAWSIDCFTVTFVTGGALTITVSGTSGDEGTALDEYSGWPASIVFNGHATQDNSSGTQSMTQTTGSYTAGASGDLANAAWGSDNTTSGTSTAGSGFALENNVNSVNNLGKMITEDQTSAANTTAAWTNSVTGNWIGGVVSIKAPSAACTPTLALLHVGRCD